MAETHVHTQAEVQVEILEEKGNLLDSILAKVNVQAPSESIEVRAFKDVSAIAQKDRGAMISAALRVFVEAVSQMETPLEKINKFLVDDLIAQIDSKISEQLDEVLHNKKFQQLESTWRDLLLLIDQTDFRQSVQIELLNVSKETLQESFEDEPELIQSALYGHIYTNAYDQPGADPYAAIVTNYEFENTPADIELLRNVSKVASSGHCPFLATVGPRFFDKESMEEWKKIPDLTAYMEMTNFVRWNSFRDTEDARYVGLIFPRYLARLPYGPDTVPIKDFNYVENVKGDDHEKYLWGKASFTFASNIVRAYVNDGWCVQIRGPEAVAARNFTGPSILTRPDFTRAIKGLPEGMSSVEYMDFAAIVRICYGTLVPVAQLAAKQADIPMDMALLPRTDTVAKHFFGGAWGAKLTDDGIAIHASTPCGVMPTMLITMAPLLLFAGAREVRYSESMATAEGEIIMMEPEAPAPAKPPRKAKPASAETSLEKVYVALLWHYADKGKYPDDLGDLVTTGALDDVSSLVLAGDSAPVTLAGGVKSTFAYVGAAVGDLAEGRDKAIWVYSRGGLGGEGRWVLFADGSRKMISEAEFEKLMDTTKKSLEK